MMADEGGDRGQQMSVERLDPRRHDPPRRLYFACSYSRAVPLPLS
jgi:hypothetical protein